MAFDVQTLAELAKCGDCLSANQKQNVLLYLLNGILENGASGGAVHNLLSATHPDTLTAAVSRGSLIVGNATPLWSELVIGAANRVLRSDGTDASWAQVALTTDVTGVLPIANGGTNSSAALNNNRIMVSSGGAIVEAAALTNGQLLIGSTGAAPVAAGLTAGTNITIGTGAGSITINAVMPGGFTGFDNPTAQVGLSAVNGVATTAMRSDAAPALSQAIAPTWTGRHIFSPASANAIQINPFGAAAGNTSELRFLELAASGTNYTGFKAADAMAASEIYVLPDAAPIANRFLRAGAVAAGVSTLSWAQVSLTADVTGILPVANGGTGTSTAFTAGSVIFAGAAGVYAQDNANFFWDDTNNRLGIGTASPVTGLSVNGVVTLFPIATAFTSSTSNPSIYAAADTFNAVAGNFGLLVLEGRSGGGAKSIIFVTGSTPAERMRVLDTGNISITTNFVIPTTTSSVGTIFMAGDRFIHAFGTQSIFVGRNSGNFTTTGVMNSAIGDNVLNANTTGGSNVGIATNALVLNTTGVANTAIGVSALASNLTGDANMAIGVSALNLNTTGGRNLAFGFQAGSNVTTGSGNIIIGYNVHAPTATGSDTLTIGNLIFGTGMDGQTTVLASGNVGVGVITPLAKFHVTNSAAATVCSIFKAAAAQSANLTEWQDSSAVILSKVNSAGNVGVRMAATALTAYLHIAAGTTAASTGPLKFTSGTSMTTAEAGAMEFTTDDLFFTITTGAARKRLLMADATAGLTSGKIPVATTNGRLVDLTPSAAYTPTNVTTDRSYDANATTLDELADVVGTIIADLQSKQILG